MKGESAVIPTGWKLVPLSSLAKVVSGGTPSRDVDSYWNGEIPWVTPTDITRTNGRFLLETQENITKAGLLSCSATLVSPGAILMTSRATVGESRIAAIEVCTNQGFKNLVPLEGVSSLFLYYQMQRLRGAYKVFGIGSTFLEVSKKDTERFEVLIPKDKGEQDKIASVIDVVDIAIEETESLITKYQQIKAGLMHDLFTRGVTADGKLRPPREQAPELYHETPIGWIPKEWGCKKLGVILQESGGYLQTGPFGSQLHAHEYTHEGIPVVMPQDIEDGRILEREIARIQETRAVLLTRHRVKLGDIIIARRGELSRAAAITHNELGWVCGTGCFLLRLAGSKLNPQFVSYAYRHHIVQRQIEGMAVGTTMPSLNNSVMNALFFPYVGEDEQARITERLEKAESKLSALMAEKGKLGKQKAGLMHDLLTGRVPVKPILATKES